MSKKKRNVKRQHARQQNKSHKRQMQSIARGAKPSDAERLSQKASRAWDQLEFDKAIRLFEQAHKKEPRNLTLYLDLGRAYLLHHQHEQAEAIFSKVLEVTHRGPMALYRIAESYQKLPRYDLAEPYYREAADHPEATLVFYTDFAKALERLHKLDEALEVLQLAEQKAEGNPHIRLLEAGILVRRNELTPAKQKLEKLITRLDLPYEVQWQSCYVLADIHNKEKAFGKAVEQCLKAKQILRKEGEQFRPQVEKLDAESIETQNILNQDHFDRWSAQLPSLSSQKNLSILTGHPRSGTTLLEQILDTHPDAVSLDERPIFGHEVSTAIRRKSKRSTTIPDLLDALTLQEIDQYRSIYWQAAEAYLESPLGDRVLVDKNPALTLQLPTVSAIFPEAKILFALRDPRDVVMSCFMQKLHMNSVSMRWLDLENTCDQYARMMSMWLAIRPMLKNPWIETRYEDLVADPEKEARRVLDFLDLPWDKSVLEYHKHAQNKAVSSPTYSDVTKKIYKGAMGRWKNYREHLEPHLHILEPFIKAFGYSE